MTIKITTLIENRVAEGLKSEHGLSIYIEAGDRKILFDSGKSRDFLENADSLDVDLEDLDYVILSHGHYDHTGGVEALLERYGRSAKFYMGGGFFNPKYKSGQDGQRIYIGNPFSQSDLDDYGVNYKLLEEDSIEISRGIHIYKNFEKGNDYEIIDPKFTIDRDGKVVNDDFNDEIVLGLDIEGGLLIILGCSHIGLVNIVDTIEKRSGKKVRMVLGGTHLVAADESRIARTIAFLNDSHVGEIYPCHCTGEDAEEMIRRNFKGRYKKNITGDIIRI